MKEYETVWPYHEGYAGVCQGGKWGYVDSQMHLVIPCRYNEIKHFSNALACVRQNGLWGYIDASGVEVVTCQYNEAHDFKSCGAIVQKGKFYGVIDKYGHIKAPFSFEIIEPFLNGYSKVKKDGYYGVMACTGDIIVECDYKQIMQINPATNTCQVKTLFNKTMTVLMTPKDSSSTIADFSKLNALNLRLAKIEKEIVRELSALESHLMSLCDAGAIDDYELELEILFYTDNLADPLFEYYDYCKTGKERLYEYADSINHNDFFHLKDHPMSGEYHCWLYHCLYDHIHVPLDVMTLVKNIDWDIIVRYQHTDQ